ncbi:hypothetical protein JB92DRAFT_828921 [Gautieria morchelliformis]|nr:hypothetical protein JB92DRAFT_828921 [Gautieria morchelliformis]
MTLAHCVLDLAASAFELSIAGLAPNGLTQRLSSAGLGLDLAIDVIVMCSMFRFFYQNRPGSKSTRSLINRLAMHTFASGALTVVANAVILATFITRPKSQIYSGASFVLPHLYANCLLAVLNARESLRRRDTDGPSIARTPSLSSFRIARPSSISTPNYQLATMNQTRSAFNIKESGETFTPCHVRIPSPALHLTD